MNNLKDICNVNIPNSLHSLLEGLLAGEDATLISGDDVVKRPEVALNVRCNDINDVADVVGKCVGQKIKVKKMTGKWLVNCWGNRIDVDDCQGFAIEHIGKAKFGDAPIRKIWFANWDGRLICKQELYDYGRKAGGRTGNIAMWTPTEMANIKNYKKIKTSLGVIGSGTQHIDHIYHWGEDTLWDWLVKSGFERFFDKI